VDIPTLVFAFWPETALPHNQLVGNSLNKYTAINVAKPEAYINYYYYS
jgi:hypothetical protein